MLRHLIEYGAVKTFSLLVYLLPRRSSRALGAGLGHLFYLMQTRRRQLGIENLKAAFPGRSESEYKAMLWTAFGHLGCQVAELFNFDAMSSAEKMNVVEIQGQEHVEQALAKGKGVIYFTGHFGCWELLVMHHSLRFTPLVVVVRTLDNPILDQELERIRTHAGTHVLSRQGAIRGLLRALIDGGSIGVMIDQHIQDRSAVVVDFLNRPAATTSAIATLALRTGVPVIPAFGLPLPGGRYRMVYEAPVTPPTDDDPDPVRTYTQRCTAVLEKYVRLHPALWLWMHRRWRVSDSSTKTVPAAAGHSESVATEDLN